MTIFKAGIKKKVVGIVIREDPDQTASLRAASGLFCAVYFDFLAGNRSSKF